MSEEVRRSAIAVIRRAGKLLFLRRYPHDRAYPDPGGPGKLCFPGGKKEATDKTTAETAEREGGPEETGFILRAENKIIGDRETTSPTGRQFLIDVYTMIITGGELISFPSEEHVEALWLTLAEALERQSEFAGVVTLEVCQLLYDWDGPYWPLPHVFHLVPHGPGHVGSFGIRRKKDYHTGADLYGPLGTPVTAMEPGTVVAIDLTFTGGDDCPLGSNGEKIWYLTSSISVEGASGTILYGEIEVAEGLEVGSKIRAGQLLGTIKQVLKPKADGSPPKNPAKSYTMLHVELYKRGSRTAVYWQLSDSQPDNLLDPTPLLLQAANRRLALAY